MALSIRLTPEDEERLERLARRTGRSKTFTFEKRSTSTSAIWKIGFGRIRSCASGRRPTGKTILRRTCGMSWAFDALAVADVPAVR